MRFVDLFAGLGGFHLALNALGHQCVFACEIDEGLQQLYRQNFGLVDKQVQGDIRKIDVNDIPAHDILCAGFPCQPYSKAGRQEGTKCPKWGDLFEHVLRIIRHHTPRYIILENVANLENHEGGATWNLMRQQIEGACKPFYQHGYSVATLRLSPHQFGIPQVRDRLLIVASRDPISSFKTQFECIAAEKRGRKPSVLDVLDKAPVDAKSISEQRASCIQVWQELLDLLPGIKVPSPLWSMEFGATYPYEHTTPHIASIDDLRSCLGSHGRSLGHLTDKDLVFLNLPSHARTPQDKFPKWKVNFIRENRLFYETHKDILRDWHMKILQFPSSLQKLEWNCLGGEPDIWRYIIQFRASGVRVKQPTTAPSLIAMTTTQVPIIGWEKRYMTPKECARLQSMDKLQNLPIASTNSYKALGNAVNVELVSMVAQALFAAGHPCPSNQ